MENGIVVPQKANASHHMIRQFHVWVYTPKDENRDLKRDLYNHACSSIIHNGPSVHQQMNG